MSEKTIFETALQKPTGAERTSYLDQACHGDTRLKQRVEALLTAHERAGEFLARPAVEQIVNAEMLPENQDATGEGSGSCSSVASSNDLDPGKTRTLENLRAKTDRVSPDHAFLGPASRPDAIGKLGHYDILEPVGRGGFGTVYKAFDDQLHRVVAIKVLAPELAANGSARERFVREAQSGAAIKSDNVVAIYAVDEEHRPSFLVMEFVAGISLQERIDRGGAMNVTEILRIAKQIAEGLSAAHSQGLIHRDIKPSNILLENGVQRVKITDFGLARAVDDANVSQTGLIAGTPMSPEQADGRRVDHRSDLFGLGSVL